MSKDRDLAKSAIIQYFPARNHRACDCAAMSVEKAITAARAETQTEIVAVLRKTFHRRNNWHKRDLMAELDKIEKEKE